MNSDFKDFHVSPTHRVASLLLAGVLAGTGVVAPCVAAGVGTGGCTVAYAATLATLDRDHAVSLTIHKYDSMDKATVNADGTTASAADVPEGANPIEGVVFSYLQIGTMNSDSSFALNADGAAILGKDAGDYTVNELQAALAEKAAGTDVAAADSFAGKAEAMAATAADGTAKADNIGQGLYIVAETAAPASVSETVDPFLVALPMASATSDGWNYDVDVYPKNNVDVVTVDKTVKDDGDGAFTDTSSATVGDTLTYQVEIGLPKVSTAATRITSLPFKDSVEFAGEYSDVKVALGDAGGVSGDSLIGAGGLNGDLMKVLDPDEVNAAAKAGDAQITVTYTVHVTGLEVGKPNDNSATVEVKRKGEGAKVEAGDYSPVYSYGIDLVKSLEGEGGDVTQAQFTLQNMADGKYIVADRDDSGVYTVTGKTDDQTAATKFSAAASGQLKVVGIEADEYELVETQAPQGYSLLAEPVTIKVAFSTNGDAADGFSDTSTAMVSDNATKVSFEDGLVKFDVLNKKKLVLPLTGGEGTLLITLLGAAALGAGAAAAYRRRRVTANSGDSAE